MRHFFARKTLGMLHREMQGENRLRRVLGPLSLTSLGIGCIIGAGIFVLTGKAASTIAGPALVVSFMVSGLACVFAALCYAEFASMAPVAGSAYTYAYATIGELFAWIIGWDLVLEYTATAATVASGWSHYFQSFLNSTGIAWLQWPARWGLPPFDTSKTHVGFVPTGAVVDLPAVLIILGLTVILVIGIRESARFNNAMVLVKLLVVLLVIVLGIHYINPANWHPFAPFGWAGVSLFGHALWGHIATDGTLQGMLAGAAIVFFAYIGFDSVSTHAEEAKNPQRDVPIGIIASLIICTVLYIAVSAVITGMVPYGKISINAPIADAFRQVGLVWAQFVISVGAIAGLTSVLMVLMLSQPRVLLAMARDGLLPAGFFGAVHPRFRTPWKSSILTGLMVATLAGVIPLNVLAELVNIGTLLAFVMVCIAVLIMRKTDPQAHRPFNTPLVPYVPILGILLCLGLMFSLPAANWLRLAVWFAIGFIIYLLYGRHHSLLARLRSGEAVEEAPPSVADSPSAA